MMSSEKQYVCTPATMKKLKFRVPVYQRLFAWEEKQVVGLLEDLYHHFKTTDGMVKFYLGAITCFEDGDFLDLVDGQQRLTVLVLLSIELEKFGSTEFSLNGSLLTFQARREDEEYLNRRRRGKNHASGTYINERMEHALECIDKFLTEKEKSDSDFHIQDFAHKAYENITFFVSMLPDSYKNYPSALNKYFEAMNSAGKGLENHEILKVKLLSPSALQQSNEIFSDEEKRKLISLWNKCAMFHTLIYDGNSSYESVDSN